MYKTIALSVLASSLLFATSYGADLKDSNPAPVAGRQILMKAELPAAVGNPRDGSGTLDPTKKETLDFWFFLPGDESAKSESGYPLMLFLHGAGERGSDPNIVKTHGPAKLCDKPEIARSWKFLTISPQCRANTTWSPLQLSVFIDELCASYPIDKSRVYVTGLSMGGFATWGVASVAADKVAAAAPICGWYLLSAAPTIKAPIWAFHGEADPAVACRAGREMVEAVRLHGNTDVSFTTYPGVLHDSWTQTYDNPELYEWFLSKSLKK